ncbi:basic proline-rich protein-like [Gracilinanus agilis]|uniref:basic proline-rich protein-like n=1 Tax=Gracilinanus agilis TaxID=191870 RepID=UPI001CFF31CF|nr:basic proline-rich protein-like [Gracilinanus agilis]
MTAPTFQRCCEAAENLADEAGMGEETEAARWGQPTRKCLRLVSNSLPRCPGKTRGGYAFETVSGCVLQSKFHLRQMAITGLSGHAVAMESALSPPPGCGHVKGSAGALAPVPGVRHEGPESPPPESEPKSKPEPEPEPEPEPAGSALARDPEVTPQPSPPAARLPLPLSRGLAWGAPGPAPQMSSAHAMGHAPPGLSGHAVAMESALSPPPGCGHVKGSAGALAPVPGVRHEGPESPPPESEPKSKPEPEPEPEPEPAGSALARDPEVTPQPSPPAARLPLPLSRGLAWGAPGPAPQARPAPGGGGVTPAPPQPLAAPPPCLPGGCELSRGPGPFTDGETEARGPRPPCGFSLARLRACFQAAPMLAMPSLLCQLALFLPVLGAHLLREAFPSPPPTSGASRF